MEDSSGQASQFTRPKSNFKIIAIVIIIVLLLITLVLGGIYALRKGLFENLMPQKQTEENLYADYPMTRDSYIFKGKTIAAVLPNSEWTIEEYYNGEGTESLVFGMEYTGLTGLKIMKEDREMFSFRGVSGVAFNGCPMYAMFPDFNPDHMNEMVALNVEQEDMINIMDFTEESTMYKEFNFLNKTFRRVEHKYYYDTVEGNNYFEPACIDGFINSIQGFSFTHSSGNKIDTYYFGPGYEASVRDLELVDEILKSVKLVSK
jgi:hypothetical protein